MGEMTRVSLLQTYKIVLDYTFWEWIFGLKYSNAYWIEMRNKFILAVIV